MWGKQNDGQMIQDQPVQPSPPAAAAPVIHHHQQAAPPAPASSPTVFGQSMKIIGEVTSDEDCTWTAIWTAR
jgi:hypothetical protein